MPKNLEDKSFQENAKIANGDVLIAAGWIEKALEQLIEAKTECKKILAKVSTEIDKLKRFKAAEDTV